MPERDEATTLREARSQYFENNGLGKDGGYGDTWVDFKIGPIPFPFPNSAARVRAVRYHDLHHMLTGYRTDFHGEMEISAWEIAAGCKGFVVAWQLNLAGMFGGATYMPRRIFRAFVRGRHSRSLYGLPLEPLLDQSVAQVRERTGLREADRARATPGDVVWFALALSAGFVIGLVDLVLFVPIMPVGLVALNLRRRRDARRIA